MRKVLISSLLIFLFSFMAFAQGGASVSSAASPTLKVSDGQKSFNGINELRFPVGCVTFSSRTAIVTCSGGSSSGTSNSQNANLFYASPTGSYGLPSFRAIVEADLPPLNASKMTAGTIATARLGSGTASSSTFLRGDQTWATLSAGSGTVENVGLSLPAEFSVTGSPVVVTGTLTGAWATQTANKVFAAPSGSTGTPSFRALVEADIPLLAQSKVTNLTTDLGAKQASDSDLTAIAGLSSTGIIARTGTGAASARTITGTAGHVSVLNGDGVSGNPTISLPQSISTSSTPTFAGMYSAGDFILNNVSGVAGPNFAIKNSPFGLADLGNLTFYPSSAGTNLGTSFGIVPKGAGSSISIRAQFIIFNTDFFADPVNYEFLTTRADGNSFTLFSTKSGAGTVRPLRLQTSSTGGAVANQGIYISTTNQIGINTDSPTAALDVNSDTLRLRTAKTPVSSSAACNQGDIAWDANYFYLCVSANTWRRSAHSSF